MNQIFKTIFVYIFCMCGLAACGVKGMPQPPLNPPELGRGKPTFKRATEQLAFPDVPSPESSVREPSASPTPSPTRANRARGR